MKVLILGGTNFFGKDIALLLRDAGHTVTVFTRGNTPIKEMNEVQHFSGDRQKTSDLEKVAQSEKWDVVIDNIAYNQKDVETALSIFKGVKRFVLTSTISVYRYSESYGQPYHEDSVNYDQVPAQQNLSDRHWKYAHGKWEAEKYLVRHAKVPWTIFRPTLVYGPRDTTERGFWYLSRMLEGGPLLLANGGLNAFKLVFSHDIAAAYLKAITSDIAEGRIYNLAQEEMITVRDFVEVSGKALGIKPEIVSVPFEILQAKGELGGQYAYNRSWVVGINRAKKDLSFQPTDFAEYVSMTACWFRDCWEGDKKKLLTTRPEELALAKKWKELVSSVV